MTRTLRVLSNKTRTNILAWLKDPHTHFGSQQAGSFDEDGVCVTLIQQRAALGQSTVSQYLAQLHGTGLITMRRVGQWTYYKRNEEAIEAFLEQLRATL